MKKISVLVALFTITTAMANAQAFNTNIDFMNGSRPAVAIELPYPQEVAEKSLAQRLESSGLKKDGSKKGVINYKEVVLNDIKPLKLDLYTKVERKKGDKEKSVVYIMASNGYDNFISPTNDSLATEKMKSYLNEMMDIAHNYNVDVQLQKQQEVIKDSEKKLEKLLEDQKDLQKKKEKIEKDIVDNAAEIEKQKVNVETQKQVITTITATKKN